jgi:hypothetical protein
MPAYYQVDFQEIKDIAKILFRQRCHPERQQSWREGPYAHRSLLCHHKNLTRRFHLVAHTVVLAGRYSVASWLYPSHPVVISITFLSLDRA